MPNVRIGRSVRVLTIVHQPDAGPGVFGEAIRTFGAELDCWLPAAGDWPAHDPLRCDAVLTFGGAMHVDQDGEHAWLEGERALLAGLLERGVPVLGVCLGAQLLAQAAGAPVLRARQPEVGWFEVAVAGEAADDPLLGPLAPGFDALEWHSYEFLLPDRATALASSAGCLQAYRIGERAWGIQFHAEVTLADFEGWLAGYRDDEDAVGVGLDPDALRARTRSAIGEWNELGRGLCARFLERASA
jgi:GMP synthase (glutamine-hydrolysing)